MEGPGDNNLTSLIRKRSVELGFDLCGIAKARRLTEYEPVFRDWLNAGMNDKMSFLERNPEKRFDPGLILPGTRSLIVTGLNYYSENKQVHAGVPVLSRYSYGRDYHDVISEKIENLLAYIKSLSPGCEGKPFVDSGPLSEKAWAREAGIGWQGRNSVIINREIGSFFFLGLLLLNVDLEYDSPLKEDYCGTCRICIESCPTGAINENRTLNAGKCIANLTIENRGPIPEELIPEMGGRVYGCDICQEVCPWNRCASPNKHTEFELSPEIADMTPEDWKNLTEEKFNSLFRYSAIRRVKYPNLMRNIFAVTG